MIVIRYSVSLVLFLIFKLRFVMDGVRKAEVPHHHVPIISVVHDDGSHGIRVTAILYTRSRYFEVSDVDAHDLTASHSSSVPSLGWRF